jgi:pyruvate/2-oxoacid:ferredoxin oxidoreductase beta subunit
MSSLESNKTCINGAKTVDAFKACKYDLNESQKMQKEETKEVEKKVDVINEDAMQKKEEVIDKKEDLDKSY